MAARYFINGLVDSNWSSVTNWSLTSGGVGGQAVPTAADDVFFDANSPACTVNTSARVCLSLNFTGYTSTITMDQQISVSGSVTLASAMTIAGTGTLFVIATSTLTSNGKTWPNILALRGTATHTLADAWTVNSFLYGSGTLATVVNGFSISSLTHLDLSVVSSAILAGTTEIIMIGTGTVSLPTSTGSLRNNLTINTAGTITFAAGSLRYNTGTLTWTAGTVAASTCTLFSTIATTFNTGGAAMTFAGLSLGQATVTFTFNSEFHITGILDIFGTATVTTTLNGSTIYIGGGLNILSSTTGSVVGTTVLRFTGTGVLSAPALTTGRVSNPITFAAEGGTLTITNPFAVNLALVTYLSGTITFNNTWTTGGAGGGRPGFKESNL